MARLRITKKLRKKLVLSRETVFRLGGGLVGCCGASHHCAPVVRDPKIAQYTTT